MRDRRSFLILTGTVMLITVWVGGCASLIGPSESIVHVAATQDRAKSARLNQMGMKALDCGDTAEATQKFLASTAADESYGPAHNNLGMLHYQEGNLYQAILAFETAMELMPHDPVVYYNLGLTLESAGKVHEAMDLYWRAVEMDPVNPNFLGNLVRLRVRLGETGPDLIVQLQDLALIETRSDWRGWADRQLALEQNDALDRGPDPPDFNSADDEEDELKLESSLDDSIIELTPAS